MGTYVNGIRVDGDSDNISKYAEAKVLFNEQCQHNYSLFFGIHTNQICAKILHNEEFEERMCRVSL